MRIALISDTHGLLRPSAVAFLQGNDFIIDGGDIGSPDMLSALRRLAPVAAVHGNNDEDGWALTIAEAERMCLGKSWSTASMTLPSSILIRKLERRSFGFIESIPSMFVQPSKNTNR